MDSWDGFHRYYEGIDSYHSWSSAEEWNEDDGLSVYKYYDGYLDSEKQQPATNTSREANYSAAVPGCRYSDDDRWSTYGRYDSYSDTDQSQVQYKNSNTTVTDTTTKGTASEVCQYYTSNYTASNSSNYNNEQSYNNDTASYSSTSSSESDGNYKSEYAQEQWDVNMVELYLDDQDTHTPMETEADTGAPVTVPHSSDKVREGTMVHKTVPDSSSIVCEGATVNNNSTNGANGLNAEENLYRKVSDKRVREAEVKMGELDNKRQKNSEDKRKNELDHKLSDDVEACEPMETDDEDTGVTCGSRCSCRGGCSVFITLTERRFKDTSPSLTRHFLLSKLYEKVEDEDACCTMYCCRNWWWVDYDKCMATLEDIFYD